MSVVEGYKLEDIKRHWFRLDLGYLDSAEPKCFARKDG